MTVDILAKIDADLDITNDPDPEVKQRWYPSGLYLGYQAVYQPAEDWVSSMGRSKYLNPVYMSLVMSGQTATAIAWNDANKDFYAPIAEQSILQIIATGQPTPAAPKRRPTR